MMKGPALSGGNRESLHVTTAARILSCADELGIAQVDSVCVIVWRGAVTRDRLRRQREALEDLVRRHPHDAGLICVLGAKSPVPEDAYRRSLFDMYVTLGPRLRCIVCVLEGSGFMAAAARSAISGLALLLPQRHTGLKFTSTVDGAAQLVSAYYDQLSAEHVRSAYAELQRTL